MAQFSVKLLRPWATSGRYLPTLISVRKEVAAQIVTTKETEKLSTSSPSDAAGEDYFSGLINNLQANNFDNARGPISNNELVDYTKVTSRPRMPPSVKNQSLRSVTQQLMAEQRQSHDKSCPESLVNSGESEQVVTQYKSHVAEEEIAQASTTENVRMTVAGVVEQEHPLRATLASIPPPALPFAQILSSVQKVVEITTEKTVDSKYAEDVSQSPDSSQNDTDSSVSKSFENIYDSEVSLPSLPSRNSESQFFFNETSVDGENGTVPDYKLSVVPSTADANLSQDLNALHFVSAEDVMHPALDSSRESVEKPSVPVDEVAPAFTPSFNLASFVNRSETLKQLVKLNVDLSVWDTKKGVAEYVLRSDFERDLKEHIRFLHDLGVPAEELGRVLTKNPFLFQQSLENLGIRINYLQSKKFTNDAIATIIVKSPVFLNKSTKDVDERLGYLQKLFFLTGDEVREVITRQPRLVTNEFSKIQQMQFTLLEEFGFTPKELKTIFVAKPKLWTVSRHAIQERFDYLHTTMGISHNLITLFPGALLCRKFIFTQRHLYLKEIGRAQYDSTKANFVSLKALVTGTDAVFCQLVAKTPVQQFNEFLKTL